MMLHVSIFCMPGGHAVHMLVAPSYDPLEVPPGWSMVEADHIAAPQGPDDTWSPGIWYAKEGTGCMVLCCPEHPLIDPSN